MGCGFYIEKFIAQNSPNKYYTHFLTSTSQSRHKRLVHNYSVVKLGLATYDLVVVVVVIVVVVVVIVVVVVVVVVLVVVVVVVVVLVV